MRRMNGGEVRGNGRKMIPSVTLDGKWVVDWMRRARGDFGGVEIARPRLMVLAGGAVAVLTCCRTTELDPGDTYKRMHVSLAVGAQAGATAIVQTRGCHHTPAAGPVSGLVR